MSRTLAANAILVIAASGFGACRHPIALEKGRFLSSEIELSPTGRDNYERYELTVGTLVVRRVEHALRYVDRYNRIVIREPYSVWGDLVDALWIWSFVWLVSEAAEVGVLAALQATRPGEVLEQAGMAFDTADVSFQHWLYWDAGGLVFPGRVGCNTLVRGGEHDLYMANGAQLAGAGEVQIDFTDMLCTYRRIESRKVIARPTEPRR